jgi:MFS family permease
MAGVYGASTTFVASRVPWGRMAEMVGMLGTSGFLATIVGTQLGDYLRNAGLTERWQLDRMFVVAAVLGLCSAPLAWLAVRGYAHVAPVAHPSLLRLLVRHHPGMLLAVVVAMALILNLPSTFLPTYAAEQGIPRIAMFFTVYSIAAVVTRVLTRQWPQRFGLRTMILLGSGGLVLSQLAFLPAKNQWLLLLPGIGFGISHAVLFPATVAVGNLRFPEQHRGLATTLILAMWDMGQLIGMPAAGAILHYSELAGLPPYPVMFVSFAGLAAVLGAAYGWSSRGAATGTASPGDPRAKHPRKRAMRA